MAMTEGKLVKFKEHPIIVGYAKGHVRAMDKAIFKVLGKPVCLDDKYISECIAWLGGLGRVTTKEDVLKSYEPDLNFSKEYN